MKTDIWYHRIKWGCCWLTSGDVGKESGYLLHGDVLWSPVESEVVFRVTCKVAQNKHSSRGKLPNYNIYQADINVEKSHVSCLSGNTFTQLAV